LRDSDLAVAIVDEVVDAVLVFLFKGCETGVEGVRELGFLVGFGYLFAVQSGTGTEVHFLNR
jgi:hypothetical protein